jgi:putative endonuclease
MENKHDNKIKGNNGEDMAAAFLIKMGFEILTRNYACPIGEIDIIAKSGGKRNENGHGESNKQNEYGVGETVHYENRSGAGETLHFIEVKTRTADYIRGRFAVNKEKQNHIRKTASHFLTRNALHNKYFCSFDVLEITDGEIEFLQNCFY